MPLIIKIQQYENSVYSTKEHKEKKKEKSNFLEYLFLRYENICTLESQGKTTQQLTWITALSLQLVNHTDILTECTCIICFTVYPPLSVHFFCIFSLPTSPFFQCLYFSPFVLLFLYSSSPLYFSMFLFQFIFLSMCFSLSIFLFASLYPLNRIF